MGTGTKRRIRPRPSREQALFRLSHFAPGSIEEAYTWQGENLSGLTQQEIADKWGVDRSVVGNALRAIRSPLWVRDLWQRQELTMHGVKSLIRLPDEDAMRACLESVKKRNNGSTVFATRLVNEYVERYLRRVRKRSA